MKPTVKDIGTLHSLTRENIGPDVPLRLDVAATLAFPDGSMTAHGLRSEVAKGRLVVERIAGKDFTTLADIANMRALCRLQRTPRTSSKASEIATGRAALERVKMISERLKRR